MVRQSTQAASKQHECGRKSCRTSGNRDSTEPVRPPRAQSVAVPLFQGGGSHSSKGVGAGRHGGVAAAWLRLCQAHESEAPDGHAQ